jgi:uncharacterized protein (UPF0264 family)
MQLLISIKDEMEVLPAVDGGADIIDIKNPAEGALGANFPYVIRRVRELTPPDIPVSAAVGDVPNLPGTVALAALGAATCGVQYVKVGLLGTQTHPETVYLLQQVCQAVRGYDSRIQIIATGYADASKVGALPPLALPAAAIEAGVDGCMLDTIRKDGTTLLTNLTAEQLRTFVAQCRAAGLLCALAGSLQRAEDITQVCRLEVDIIGVRTAACHGDRTTGKVDRHKVQQLKTLMASNGSPLSGPVSAAPSAVPEPHR